MGANIRDFMASITDVIMDARCLADTDSGSAGGHRREMKGTRLGANAVVGVIRLRGQQRHVMVTAADAVKLKNARGERHLAAAPLFVGGLAFLLSLIGLNTFMKEG